MFSVYLTCGSNILLAHTMAGTRATGRYIIKNIKLMIASINLYFSTLMFKALKNKERYLVSPCTKTLF